jgi:hypothetical protein
MKKGLYLLAGLGLVSWTADSHAVPLRLNGRTWTDVGRVMKSSDTLQTNFNGNWQQTMGMQFDGAAQLTENLEGAFGFGLNQVYHSLGTTDQEKFTLSKFINYVSQARLTYSYGDKAQPLFKVDMGDFAYNYAPQVKNLGLYLFRGPVYPGFLVSGFKDIHTDTTRGNFLGFHVGNTLGNFQHDFIVSSERDLPPSFDWSVGYVAKYKAFNALEVGAGVNFYHLIAENADITDPKKSSAFGLFGKDSALVADAAGTPVDPYRHFYTDGGTIDTVKDAAGQPVLDGTGQPLLVYNPAVTYTHRGTKVMGMFSLDIKKILGLDSYFGEKDMLLYGEGAIVGVKNYGTIYGKMTDRMPIMIGFNLPTFGALDFLSVEVEHYTAKYKPDYSKLGYDRSLYFKNIAAPQLLAGKAPSAVPISLKDLAGDKYQILEDGSFYNPVTNDTIPVKGTAFDPENFTADDWKWSINAEKTLAGHVQFTGQIANDHFVPRPARIGLINEGGGLSQIFTSTKDWYFMFRVGYFF